ncbi:hypothetical protein [Olleya sp. YS]|uniref:hypothetical protein n=1 Tax=Olleya sp. YS TaxID=3028318 RepID=UPI0024342333|nr:hypothetical protein [Olleya sp. YS]WGD33938.1 hypothetical protein Ollyesu_09115 [Olleya sp. YS]
MYDTSVIVQQINKLPKEAVARVEKPFYWNNCLWSPNYNKKIGEITSYVAKLKNLDLKLRGSELTISNSLQKFYMNNNYKPFSYTDVVKAVAELDSYFDFDLYEAQVQRTSVGVVINDIEDNTFKNWLEYRGKKPLVMRNKTRVYGAHFKATNYNIKGYDKTYQTKNESGITVDNSLIRFELEASHRYTNTGKNAIGIYIVADLVNKIKFDAFGDELLKVYDTIKKQPIINYQELQPKEILLMGAMKDNACFNGLKKHHKDSFTIYRKKYAKLLEKYADFELENNIRSKILEQINYCKNN